MIGNPYFDRRISSAEGLLVIHGGPSFGKGSLTCAFFGSPDMPVGFSNMRVQILPLSFGKVGRGT